MPHQVVSTRLIVALSNACPEGLHVVAEPAVQLSADTEFVPDIAVVRADQIEVRSPSTALIDLNRKKTAYERFGVPSYWIMVPDPASPELIAFELRDGRYAEAAQAAGTAVFRAAHPFPAAVVPAELVAGLPTA
jgi:Uma2 family endonuclease